jgi:hypothetical protein
MRIGIVMKKSSNTTGDEMCMPSVNSISGNEMKRQQKGDRSGVEGWMDLGFEGAFLGF